MRLLSRTREQIARYYAADLFRDRRDFIRERPNYVGGRVDRKIPSFEGSGGNTAGNSRNRDDPFPRILRRKRKRPWKRPKWRTRTWP
jgi:hypothetical protein